MTSSQLARLSASLLSTLAAGGVGTAWAATDAPGTGARDGPATPRALVGKFLDLTRAGRDAEAARLLELPAGGATEGPALARHLKAVLDRSLWVDLDQVYDAEEGRQGDGLPGDRDELGRVPGPTGQQEAIRLACEFGLVYGTTGDQLRAVLAGLERVLRGHPLIWPDGVVVRFKQLGAFSLDVEVMAWFRTADWGEFQAIRQGVLLRFMYVIQDIGTSMAFPTQTLHLAPSEAGGVAAPGVRLEDAARSVRRSVG